MTSKEEREEIWKGIKFRCYDCGGTGRKCLGCQRQYVKLLLEQYLVTGEVYLERGVRVDEGKVWLMKFLQQSVKKKQSLFTNFQAIEILDAYGLNEGETDDNN